MDTEEVMDLLQYTRENCLHKTERLAVTLRANQTSRAWTTIIKDLIYIERRVVWESDDMQNQFNVIVYDVGKAIPKEDNLAIIAVIQKRVAHLFENIQKNNPRSESATTKEFDFYARKLRRITKRLQKIKSILLSHEFNPLTVQAVQIRYNELSNMCCIADQWLINGLKEEEDPPDRNFLKKIFKILESHISDLENDCTLWDRVVDTVADVFVSSHNRRCFRRSSPAV
jgi:hypothetical protein